MSFSSQSSGTNGSDITDGQLNVDLHSDGVVGHYIDRIQFQEAGDTTLTGTGTSNTYSSAAITLELQILAIDYNDAFEFYPGTNVLFGTWTLPPPKTGLTWNGSLTLDVTAYLESLGYSGRATWVSIQSDNVLATASEVGTSAFIDKKAEGLSITAITVPEPGSLSLLVLGGALLLVTRFGRKN